MGSRLSRRSIPRLSYTACRNLFYRFATHGTQLIGSAALFMTPIQRSSEIFLEKGMGSVSGVETRVARNFVRHARRRNISWFR